jgi:hypothetical protein
MKARTLLQRIAVAAGLAGLLFSVAAPAQVAQEQVVKAGFLFNFARFVDWPEAAFRNGNQLVLCLAGTDPIGAALEPLKDKSVSGHPIDVRRLKAGDPLKPCHILFVSDSEKRRLDAIIAEVRGAPVLLVSEIDNFLELGGMIQLVALDNRVQFEVNLAAATRGGLTVSSKLLKVAASVIGGH